MLVEYERLWIMSSLLSFWIFKLIYLFLIYEDSSRHDEKAWPWIIAMLLFNSISHCYTDYYDWYVLPSRGIEWYKIPSFTYDTSQMVEPLWVLDFYVLWNAVINCMSTTLSVYIIYWIYKDCKKSGMRATPWIFLMNVLPALPWPLSMVFPLGSFGGQLAVLCGYLLHKLGYI